MKASNARCRQAKSTSASTHLIFRTEVEFELPKGYVDRRRMLHQAYPSSS